MITIRKLMLASAALVIANLSFAQSADTTSNTGTTTGAQVEIKKGGDVAPSVGQQATLPNRNQASGSGAATSADPYVQKRESDAMAKDSYKDEKKMARQHYKAQKKAAKTELKAEKQDSTQMRNEQIDPASRKNSEVKAQ